ncbi:hypothetical protein IHV25_06110 [Phaeovibrio sulfidiphilus]|uniref:Uncharacterized protein n=1 Tax=Phaeovibrio sulfidiphilus TaxID=1220600 RepID=A0A8J7CDS0_9PROT|nr:hypothetical protein [Phaeovibrio sulfidiphilus]MBE1237219.1 hypothetical protein [Phaeovibrio sulfidiphilus]
MNTNNSPANGVILWTVTDGTFTVEWHTHPAFLDIGVNEALTFLKDVPEEDHRESACRSLGSLFHVYSCVGSGFGYHVAALCQWLAVTGPYGSDVEDSKFARISVQLGRHLGGGYRVEAIYGETPDGRTVVIDGSAPKPPRWPRSEKATAEAEPR